MRRISAGILAIALALTMVAPMSAGAAAPSATSLLREQIASRTMIGSLLGTSGSRSSQVKTINFGKAKKSATKAVIPVAVYTVGGARARGTLVLRKYSGKWYFYSITRGTHDAGVSRVHIPAGITTSIMKTAIRQQASHQYMLTGIISGGYHKLTVTSRHSGYNTRQVNIRLSGGSRKSTTGRVLAYRKTASNGAKYWFISTIK